MKNILYTIILSFLFSSAYAGEVDGKGLICFKNKKVNGVLGFWFDQGKANTSYIDTIDKIKILTSTKDYKVKGVNKLRWTGKRRNKILDTEYVDMVFTLNRVNLKLKVFETGFIYSGEYKCKPVRQEYEIYDALDELIKTENESIRRETEIQF